MCSKLWRIGVTTQHLLKRQVAKGQVQTCGSQVINMLIQTRVTQARGKAQST